jgi:hypothetical protein
VSLKVNRRKTGLSGVLTAAAGRSAILRANGWDLFMDTSNIPFGTTDWTSAPETIHQGETGTAR